MLFETLILSLAAGLVFGGSIKNLQNVHIRWPGFLFAGLLLRYVPKLIDRLAPALYDLPLLRAYHLGRYDIAAIFFIASYVYLIAGLVVNLQEWPMFVLMEGTVLNFLVVAANGGSMPVSELCLKNADFPMSRIVDGVIDLNHIIETGSTRLVFLADILPINNPYPFPRILSIGDIIMCAGFFLYIVKKVTNDFHPAGRTAKSAKRRECID